MKEKLLFLTTRYPYPPHKGDTIRVHAILHHLSQFYDIHLMTFSDTEITNQRKAHLDSILIQQTIWHECISIKKILLGMIKSVLLKIPVSAAVYESKHKKNYLSQLMRQENIKKIYVFSLALMSIVPDNAESVYLDLCDIEIFKWHDYSKQSSKILSIFYRYETHRAWDYLKEKMQTVSAFIVISAYEARLLTHSCDVKKPVFIIPNGVKVGPLSKTVTESNKQFMIVFVGVMSYKPNVEAMRWFTEFVWPLLKSEIPMAQLMIVGQSPVDAIKKLARDSSIQVTGYVPDVSHYLRQAEIIISPIKMAYGVQNKVLEALCFGKKIILTPQSLRGIDWYDEGIRVVSRNSKQWVSQILELQSQSLSTEWLLHRRRDFFKKYDWDNCLLPLQQLSKMR